MGKKWKNVNIFFNFNVKFAELIFEIGPISRHFYRSDDETFTDKLWEDRIFAPKHFFVNQ